MLKQRRRGKLNVLYTKPRNDTDSALWRRFADEYAAESRDTDGLIACQCRWQCGQRAERPDLHHVQTRADRPDLYFVKSNLLWLIHEHHEREHRYIKPRNYWGGPTLTEIRNRIRPDKLGGSK